MKIAILIPSFNSAKTISATLESLQESPLTYLTRIYTVYLADDCSQDNTISLAEATWKPPIPLYVLNGEKNLGERGNVNRAIALIKEQIDWFFILHSDDIAKPNWLEMMISRIESCGERVGSICSSWDTLQSDGTVIPGEDNPSRPIQVIEGTIQAVRDTLLQGCWWHISGCAIRISAFEDIGEFDRELPQLGDWEWLLRCLNKGWSVEYIPRTLILYRNHSSSVSSESFRTDRDLRESLKIVQSYTPVLSSSSILTFYGRRMNSSVRRIGRALSNFNLSRSVLAVQTFNYIFYHWIQTYINKLLSPSN